MTIEQLTDQILDFRDKRDWSQYHKAKDMAAAVAIEAAELQEHFLWKTHDESAGHLSKHGFSKENAPATPQPQSQRRQPCL
jgi:NTP pyrophosphatase (non-canonical NTP hydrolase)